jgi:hypothetical protein
MIEQPLDMPNTAINRTKLAERFMGEVSRGAGTVGGKPLPDSTAITNGIGRDGRTS